MAIVFEVAAWLVAFIAWLAGCAFVKEWATVPFCSDARILFAVVWIVSPIYVIGYAIG